MNTGPTFSAVSTSARQLYQLFRCIAFSANAKVQITSSGIRFTVDETRAVQGLAFVESGLFSSYNLNVDDDATSLPPFQISIIALLETLQIFGLSDTSSSYRNQNGGFMSSYNAFTTPALALGGTCRITYEQIGSPLSITIQEGGMNTSCNINTYELDDDFDDDGGIPLDRNSLCLKVILRSMWLHDAMAELSGTNPTVLIINASERSAPYFALEGHGGPFGDCTIEYQPESNQGSNNAKSKRQPAVTETFSVAVPSGVGGRIQQRYKFDHIKKAGRAMAVASKVSIRQDLQGCLSLQFMIELGEGGLGSKEADRGTPGTLGNMAASGPVSFIDFRFVPLVNDESEEDEYEEEDEGSEDGNYVDAGDGRGSEHSE